MREGISETQNPGFHVGRSVETMAESDKVRRPRMRSWEADEDVAKLLDLVTTATSASVKDIVNEALRKHGPEIARRLLSEREAAQQELEVFLSEKFVAPKTQEPRPDLPDAPPPAPAPTRYAKPRRK
jgi:hypothetical protein